MNSNYLENYCENINIILEKSKISVKFRSVKTLNGLDFDVAKSALQKFIRRGMFKESLYIACELDLFKFIDGGQSVWTNFYNRLRIIVLEDIGMAFPNLILIVDPLFDSWKEEKTLSTNLPKIIDILCHCPHSRYYSHLRSVFSDKKEEKDDNDVKSTFYLGGKDENLRETVEGLIWSIKNKKDSTFYYIQKIMDIKKTKEKYLNNTRSGFLIFSILEYMKIDNKIINICKKWYKTLKTKEDFLCCVHAIYTIFNSVKETYIYREWDINVYNRNLKNKTINIPDYVYDIHTKKGKKLNRNTINFAIEGALVVYEKNFNNKYKNIYNCKKINNIEISNEFDEFIFKIRTQLVCSAIRPDTYYAKNKLNENIVVKGPYLSKEDAMKTINVQSILRLFEGINVVDANLKYLIPSDDLKTCLGSRITMKNNPSYFVVMNDLFNVDEYPCIIKESKVWEKTKVVDYDTLFENKNYGFGVASEMSEKALFSFILQIFVRYILKIGDFASRNFVRIKDKVYNLDTEGVNVGDTIRFSKKEKEILENNYRKNILEYKKIINKWIKNDYIWKLIFVTFKYDCIDRAKELLNKSIF